MQTERIDWDGADPVAFAAGLRDAVPEPSRLSADVAHVMEEVRNGGDASVRGLGERFDGVLVEQLAADAGQLDAALERISPELRAALQTAASNIETVARAQVNDERKLIELAAGHTVETGEAPVRSAAIYAPGGRAPYPSTVLMGVIAARAAGVDRVVLSSPPGEEGRIVDPVLAAAAIAGADEVYAMGGAQAIAALAYGTETIDPVDVIAGPGGPWVQEAKLIASREVGIDSYAGPSELVVVADESADARWVALDVCAQAEHGTDGLLVVISSHEGLLDSLGGEIASIAATAPSVSDAPCSLVLAPDLDSACELARELAAEHLELACADAEERTDLAATSGCVFVGHHGATAFGDYAAGSNHVLPTGGAGRFTGPLGPSTFRRRISVVRMNSDAAVELGEAVDTIARSEGFDIHGASAVARGQGDND